VIGKIRRELSLWTCKMRAKLSPGAHSVGRLARKYLENGRLDESARILHEGMTRYPGLSELEDVAHFVAQLQLRQQELRMQDVLLQARKVYHALALSHIAVGDLKAATETVWAGLQRFPDCAPLYRCLGELHLRLFLEDLLAHDGVTAAENLERALGLDETDTQARAYLGGFYFRVGSYNRAARHLRHLLDRMSSNEPDYPFVEQILVHCNQRQQQPSDGPLTDYLNAVYENHQFTEDVGRWAWPELPGLASRDASLIDVKPDLVRKTVVGFLPQSKASGAVLLTQADEQIVGTVPFEHSPETLPATLRGLADTSGTACHRMELGHSRRAIVQLSSSALGFLRLGSTEVVFLFDADHAAKSVSQTMDHFTDCLATAIGEHSEGNPGEA